MRLPASVPSARGRARRATLLMLALLGALTGALPATAGSPKILLYHHVATDTPASTSVTPDVFEAHLALIEAEGYQVVPLTRIVDNLMSGGTLSSDWVAITFDDAYESVLTEAAPRLAARQWPFTVFVSTDAVDAGTGPNLDWDGLRALVARGAAIANHTMSHPHMIRRPPDEDTEAFEARLTREVIGAQDRLTRELKKPLRIVAYPYGEFDPAVAALMQALGFAALGQQSGPVGNTTNVHAIPRFPLATGFDSVASLKEKLRTEHLPLLEPEVPATVLAPDALRPTLTLRTDGVALNQARVTCFVDGSPTATISWPDSETLQVRTEKPLRAGRSKYTCTAPYPDKPASYYWHTHLFMKPHRDGSWYGG